MNSSFLDAAILMDQSIQHFDLLNDPVAMRQSNNDADLIRSKHIAAFVQSEMTELQFFSSVLRNFGLYKQSVPGDGNCGVYALLYAYLGKVADLETVRQFRDKLADHIVLHKQLYQAWSWSYPPDEFGAYSVDDTDEHHQIVYDFERFIARTRVNMWINELHLHAIADMMKLRIAVLDKRRGSPVLRVYKPTLQAEKDIVVICNSNGNHWDFMRQIPVSDIVE